MSKYDCDLDLNENFSVMCKICPPKNKKPLTGIGLTSIDGVTKDNIYCKHCNFESLRV